jgi:pyoverdine/dityrosine biosynthesis protein Dit1
LKEFVLPLLMHFVSAKTTEDNMEDRKYLPTLSELVDRLSIAQLKEVFITNHKDEYSQEIADIVHDIQLLLNESDGITAETIRAIVVLSQMNLHIWHNESNYRKGIKDGNNLELTHGLNGIRNTAKNKIQEVVGGRKDYKIDCLAAEFKDWEISWDG